MKVHIQHGTVAGTIVAPPSKSVTHRAVALASLARGESIIENCLLSDDTRATIEACKSFGAEITKEGNILKIKGTGGTFHVSPHPIDCGLSGTTLRFTLALAALTQGETTLTGERRLFERPLRPLVDALGVIGANVTHEGNIIRVKGRNLKGGDVALPGNVSSQFISALLMIAPFVPKGLSIAVEEPFYSRPYVDLTIDGMRAFGVEVTVQGNRFSLIPRQTYKARAYTVEGDYSSAQYWFAAAAITGGEVRVEGLNPDSRQGDKKLLDILREIGNEIRVDDGVIAVRGGKSLKPFSVDGRDIPDLVPALAVLAAVGNGVSEITNISHLSGKESDRLAAPVEELKKMGIRAEIKNNALRIHGGTLKGAVINPHGDHRFAMAFAVAGTVAEGETVIQDAEAVSKSYPGFWDDFERLGGNTISKR